MSEIERLRVELAELEQECERRLSSGRYRLGLLLVNTARDWRQWPLLPWRLFRLWRALRSRRRSPPPGSPVFEGARSRLDGFLQRIGDNGADELLFIFSGTTQIQGVRGNRPIRQALAARRAGLPVLFSYHRARYDEAIPESGDDGLLQLPGDLILQLLDIVRAADLGAAARRILLVSYPYPGIEKKIEAFRRSGWVVLYDCRDDWEEFGKVGMARWYRRRVERAVVAGCHVTLCVSRPLCEKMQRMVPDARVELSPNAVDARLLEALPPRQSSSEHKRVGYFGHLSAAWFDWPALADIAERCPHYRFEIIGHSAPVDLDLPANVHMLGPRPWESLAEVASTWNAAIIPFRMGALADGVDPVKVYEYLAFGLPVVSFRMPQIEGYPGVTTVDNHDAFCRALDAACQLSLDRGEIRQFLERNTWETRIEELRKLAAEVAQC